MDRKRMMCVMQMNIKKHLVYGSIVFIWIVVPALEITFAAVGNDIVDGTCKRFPTNMSYVTKKTTGLLNVALTYLLPLIMMVFCYARVVHALQTKVS